MEDSSYKKINLPEEFLNNKNKFSVHEFIISSRIDVNFSLHINIENNLLSNLKYFILNSTSVEIINPYRGNYGEQVSFAAVLQFDTQYDLPFNLPEQNINEYSPLMIDYGSTRQPNIVINVHPEIKGKTFWDPASIYFDQRNLIKIPYFPFFSNCKGFGKHIPIFALFEQNENCTLISLNETIPVTLFEFGKFPVADSCKDIYIECIYDEVFSNITGGGTKWFELTSDTLFYLISNPVTADEMNSADTFSIDDVYINYS